MDMRSFNGFEAKIVKVGFGWWNNDIGCSVDIVKYRPDWEDYLLFNGNAIEPDCIEFVDPKAEKVLKGF
jgi:hypothetical protein